VRLHCSTNRVSSSSVLPFAMVRLIRSICAVSKRLLVVTRLDIREPLALDPSRVKSLAMLDTSQSPR